MQGARTQAQWCDLFAAAGEESSTSKDAGPGNMTIPVPDELAMARKIDHTLLKLDATQEQIDNLCDEAKEFKFKVGYYLGVLHCQRSIIVS